MGLLVFITALRLSDPQSDRARPTRIEPSEPKLAFGFSVDELREEQPIDLHVELRDNTVDREWSRQEDFELAATFGRLTFVCNNHFIIRNMSEAQVVASYTIEY
jgi:hypothetical protein